MGTFQSPREAPDAPRFTEHVRVPHLTVGGPALHESIRDALHLAARATRFQSAHGQPDERSRRALDAVCELAHHDELRVEQLMLLLKDAWRHIPEVQSVARRDADVTLSAVITHCITEFYRPFTPRR